MDEGYYSSDDDWMLVCTSNMPENEFVKTFETQEDALAEMRELIDYASGYPCDPANERDHRFKTTVEAVRFLKATGNLRVTDHTSYGDDFKLFRATPEIVEKIFNLT